MLWEMQKLTADSTNESLDERFTEGFAPDDIDYPILKILVYNMRHVQHHIVQLNLLIRQDLNAHRLIDKDGL